MDATPTAAVAVGSEDKAILIGGLGKGGKGYFALDITNADSVTGSTGETDVADMVLWEYPRAGVGDDDLGYSYSKAYTVQSYATGNDWIVVFGNGYDSPNGHAVLYVLDLEGNILRKLDTGAGSCNGLSTPSVVDVNNDYRVDYAYAGDLKGNLWKFDLRDPDPANWAVAFSAGGIPQPLFQAVGQSITAKPDVMRHCVKHGYMVVFGTGRYLGDSDRGDASVQTLYGIWDYGDDDDDDEYLGAFVRGASPQLANQPAHVELLEQTVADYRTIGGRRVLTLSGTQANWETTSLSTGGSCGVGEGLSDCDPDGVGEKPDPLAHAGWFFDLSLEGERVIRENMIREAKAIFVSTIPNESPCSGGGDSMVYEMDACSGGRLAQPQFDMNSDRLIDESDKVEITDGRRDRTSAPNRTELLRSALPPGLTPHARWEERDQDLQHLGRNPGEPL